MRQLKATILILVLLGLSVTSESALAQTATPTECGAVIEDEFTQDNQPKLYTIQLSAGDRLQTSVVPLGSTLLTSTALYAPNDAVIWVGGDPGNNWSVPVSNPVMNTDVLSANGTYTIVVYNNWLSLRGDLGDGYGGGGRGGIGVYTLFIGCILRDGTVIEPGDTLPDDSGDSNDPDGDTAAPIAQPAPDFGFPGVASRDFSDGIEIPLTLGQPQVAPIASDVALYTYAATAEETRTLSVSRASGTISIGVAVIHSETNALVFLGGMPSSNNLTVELTFPTDGTYAIGLFRLDTAELTGTSGAVQIVLE